VKSVNQRPAPESYRRRTYRRFAEQSDLCSSYVSIRETDLHILATSDVTKAGENLTLRFRLQVENYIAKKPGFATSLTPLPDDPLAPPLIREMLAAGSIASVGPMAAVAGAIAQFVGLGLVDEGHNEIIVENGGDIFLQRRCSCTVAIFAGQSSLSNRVAIRLPASGMPAGICTSSGTVGHSLSLGNADSVTVVARSAVVADAVATRLGNEVGHCRDVRDGINRALQKAAAIAGIKGVLVIRGELMGATGDIEITPVD